MRDALKTGLMFVGFAALTTLVCAAEYYGGIRSCAKSCAGEVKHGSRVEDWTRRYDHCWELCEVSR